MPLPGMTFFCMPLPGMAFFCMPLPGISESFRLHDAVNENRRCHDVFRMDGPHGHDFFHFRDGRFRSHGHDGRSEEHTSELQSHLNLVCRLLLEKKKHYKC